jgi:hypothetical protein
MSLRWKALAGLLLLYPLVSPVRAGITVTSYTTLASTNGFAPSLQGPYFAQQTLETVTPALAHVSGDWTGPNADATPDTWHFVGTSQASSTTTFDANSYSATAAGSFQYQIDTTTDFIDPRPSVFTPGGAANYVGFFETDVSMLYSISAKLNLLGRVRLGSIEGGEVFNFRNTNLTPLFVNLTGTLPPGHYNFLASSSLSASNLPNGINHYARNGSFEDVLFTVQVPEPITVGPVIALIGFALRRHRWRVLAS